MAQDHPVWQLPAVTPVQQSDEERVRAVLDGKAKPPGSLGIVEDVAVRLALIWGQQSPRATKAVFLVFAGDHGMAPEVSRYPSAVTAVMVHTFLNGRASINAFANAIGIDLRIIDAGVAGDLSACEGLIHAKIRHGTADAVAESAMNRSEAGLALQRGCDFAMKAVADGADLLGLGEMGIGNTASAALLMHRLAPAALDDCLGVGAGQDDAGMVRKRAAVFRAAARSDVTAPLDVLAEFGGFEIAMMAGAVIGAAASRRPVIIDGFIASAAALVAVRLCPAALDYCIFGHRSAERGHALMLAAIPATPILDLNLRLGEGTGAALAVPIVRAAANLLTDVANLADLLPAGP